MGKARKSFGRASRYWSAAVTQRSDAITIPRGLFRRDDPASIARSLKRAAERSRRRKASPFRSGLSLLNFYINRAGRNLSVRRRRILERAKVSLRRLYGK